MPITSLYKIVVRELPHYRTVQVHEVYKLNVGNKIQELINEAEVDRIGYNFTITKLR